ncbi:MAG TPA: PQQ-binding-like beta-propeller repeat protein [Pirellulales bacterium]|jgi:outer membrane protein assembly factor BamB|nr:PQQ-binding-like beta-propeller repeat protein [Pirellulales bacterium]
MLIVRSFVGCVIVVGLVSLVLAATKSESGKPPFGPHDWPMWGGTPARDNTPDASDIPTEFSPGEFDAKTGAWVKGSGENVRWVSSLGSQSYGNPVVANGQVYVGTNNGYGYIKRYPATVDLGCLLAFRESDGEFLWQASSEKLPTGRVHDWPLQGICSTPMVEGDRLWYVTSRGEVTCLDTQGFHDGENDGPFTGEKYTDKHEADVIWVLDMMKELGVSQHNMCSCSIGALGDLLFVCTSNGVDETHINLPAPKAPSFLCVHKHTGKLIWQDASPGENILHGQWSSPCIATLGGVPQVIFAGGDAWLYSFQADEGKDGHPIPLWKFDANPKESKYILGGRGTRNEIIGTPVAYEERIYLAVGQDPEHGEGIGHLWCIDPTKRGDISGELAFKLPDTKTPIPHTRRLQAVNPEEGEVSRPNPNSAVIWHYSEQDSNGDGKISFEETMHRTCATATVKNGLLFIPDFSGLFHCLDANTGKVNWTHDLFAATWGSALVVDGKVYVGDEEGKLTVFKESAELEVLAEIDMSNSIYSTPVVANNTLFIANKTHVFAIANGAGK